jgi:DNA-binding NtrC family response regulator
VRELKNEVDRAVLLATDGGHLEGDHFGPVRYAVEHARTPQPHTAPAVAPAIQAPSLHKPQTHGDLHGRVDAVEREAIAEALRASRGNKSKAAELLGITRNGLALKVKRLGLET